MISPSVGFQAVVALAVVVTYFSRQLASQLIPLFSRSVFLNSGITLLLFCFWVQLGSWALNEDRIDNFRKSLEGLRRVERLEFCEDKKEFPKNKALLEFERVKQSLETQVKFSVKKDSKEKEGDVCQGRAQNEPWSHFRYRLLMGYIEKFQAFWRDLSWGSTTDYFSKNTRFTLGLINRINARLAERMWRLLRTGENRIAFHQIWIESPVEVSSYPTPSEIAQEIVEGTQHHWAFVQRVVPMLLPAPQRWKTDFLAPVLRNLPEKGFCHKIATDPEFNSEAKVIWNHLRIFQEGCDRRFKQFEKLPEECAPEKIQRAVTLACLEKGEVGQKLSVSSEKIQWPGLPENLGLSTQTLIVPEDYFEADRELLPYRAYRFAHAFEQVLFPASEGIGPVGVDRPTLLEGPVFQLSRLEMLQEINPFGAKELDPSVQAYFWYDRLGPRLERFQSNLVRALHQRKGVLE